MSKRATDTNDGEVAIVRNVYAHIDIHTVYHGLVIQGKMINGCAIGRGSSGRMEREDKLVYKAIGGREFLMALPTWVFIGFRLRGFIRIKDVGLGFSVGGMIGNMEIDRQGASLVVGTIHDVVAR